MLIDPNQVTARMLTCATHLTTIEVSHILTDDQMEAIIDARSLLIQAADMIIQLNTIKQAREKADEVAVPITTAAPQKAPAGFWYDTGYEVIAGQQSRAQCPHCKAPTERTVYHQGKKIFLSCNVCGDSWSPAG